MGPVEMGARSRLLSITKIGLIGAITLQSASNGRRTVCSGLTGVRLGITALTLTRLGLDGAAQGQGHG